MKCNKCGKRTKIIFPHDDLETDSMDDFESGIVVLNNICPKCNTVDCCGIEFEKLDQDTGIIKT